MIQVVLKFITNATLCGHLQSEPAVSAVESDTVVGIQPAVYQVQKTIQPVVVQRIAPATVVQKTVQPVVVQKTVQPIVYQWQKTYQPIAVQPAVVKRVQTYAPQRVNVSVTQRNQLATKWIVSPSIGICLFVWIV